MDNFEKQLSNLPKKRLRLTADLKIRFRIYLLIWRKNIAQFNTTSPLRYKMIPVTAGIILAITAITIPAYAYFSPQVTKANLLYPIRHNIEDAQIVLSFNAVSKVKTYNMLSARRLREAEIISQKNIAHGNISSQSNEFTETLNDALILNEAAHKEAEKMENNKNFAAANNYLTNSKEKNIKSMANIARIVGVRADDRTMGAITVAFTALDPEQKPKLPANSDKTENINEENISLEATSSPASDNQNEKKESAKISSEKPKIKESGNKAVKNRTAPKEPISKNNQAVKPTTTPAKIILETNRKKTEQSLKKLKENIKRMQENLNQKKFNQEDAGILMERMNEKVKKAEEAWNGEKYNDLDLLISATEALANYGEYFIKQENDGEHNEKSNGQNNNDDKSRR